MWNELTPPLFLIYSFIMPTNRKIVFANNYFYHVFNRGVDKREVFTNKKEYLRAIMTLNYYQYSLHKIKLSRFLSLPEKEQLEYLSDYKTQEKLVDIIAYCLMPNHFHFLLRQIKEKGISKFLADFANSYTKYFNTKHDRTGHLFQGQFKAVFIESDEQLLHLSRYIHLNPSTSSIVKIGNLKNYPWSSLPEYLKSSSNLICNTEPVLGFFKKAKMYEEFVFDQALYAKELHFIKHLLIE